MRNIAPFMDFSFETEQSAFYPRFETEILVEKAISKYLQEALGISDLLAKLTVKVFVETPSIAINFDYVKTLYRFFSESLAVADIATPLLIGHILGEFLSQKKFISNADLYRMRATLPKLTTDDISKMQEDLKRLLDDWQ